MKKKQILSFACPRKPFQLSVFLRMLYILANIGLIPYIPSDLIFKFAALTTVVMNSMGPKLASVIHYQLLHWTKPTMPPNHMIDYKLAVLGINLKKFPLHPAPFRMRHPVSRRH